MSYPPDHHPADVAAWNAVARKARTVRTGEAKPHKVTITDYNIHTVATFPSYQQARGFADWLVKQNNTVAVKVERA